MKFADKFLASYKPDMRGCMLLDIRMPGTDGMGLLTKLASSKSQLRIIMMTGHGDVPTAVRAMRIGAFDFLEKPFTQDIIFKALERALEEVAKGAPAAPSDVRERLERLTPREREVMDLVVLGHANKVIAARLGISPRTVEIHRARVMEKMEVATLAELVRLTLAPGARDA